MTLICDNQAALHILPQIRYFMGGPNMEIGYHLIRKKT